ncbi:hypothetical protein HPB48_009177 [Haemaphysalis longicornis]|uniref:Uncharacterized protein n=1 Tax=Haemaphysalis longicornis TaxID=44386 RepID=A0A9J6GIM4_HAELO|nr:hypothetical protein HPB48_009177 [Haemaphysalis longicornis]
MLGQTSGSGSNDHPTPTQFLISQHCLNFYLLVQSPFNGNNVFQQFGVAVQVRALPIEPTKPRNKLDYLLHVGRLPDHNEIVGHKSDVWITY